MSNPPEKPIDSPVPPTVSGVVYISWVTSSKVEQEKLTSDEAQEQGILQLPGYNLIQQSATDGESGAALMRCPTCGWTERNIEKTGRLGCPDCYAMFTQYLMPNLRRMHRGEKHVGKTPRWAETEQIRRNRLTYLESEMGSAIRREAYEEAAAMRDQILELKRELK